MPDPGALRLRSHGSVTTLPKSKSIPAPRRGIIRNIRKLTKDVAEFDVHLSAPMTFEAGQFVVLETEDLVGARAYSMVNFESETDRIGLVLKRKPGGGFSDWLFAERDGDPEVAVFGPLGRAVFRPQEGKNLVCIVGGSGIAGIMSILKCAVDADYFRNHKGSVFFGVRTFAGHVLFGARSRALSRHRTATLKSLSPCPMKLR